MESVYRAVATVTRRRRARSCTQFNLTVIYKVNWITVSNLSSRMRHLGTYRVTITGTVHIRPVIHEYALKSAMIVFT